MAVGNSHQIVILSCMWIPGAQVQHGKSCQLAVMAAFSADCGACVWLVDVVAVAVVQVAVASCPHIAAVPLLPVVLQHDLSRADPEVSTLVAVVVGVAKQAAAAAAAVVVASSLALLPLAR